jgi:hypothetical protein
MSKEVSFVKPSMSARARYLASGLVSCALGCGGVADDGGPELESRSALLSGGVLEAHFEAINPEGDVLTHRSGHSVVAVKNKLYVVRGVTDDFETQTNTFPEDVLSFNPRSERLRTLRERGDEPGGLSYSCAAGDSAGGGALYLFGGASYVFELRPDFFPSLVVSDALYRFDVPRQRWTLLEPEGARPTARSGCTAELFGGAMYMFGGISRFFEVNDELWKFQPESETWLQLEPEGPVPPARYKPTVALDRAAGKIYYYGGLAFGAAGFARLEDFWVYDIASNSFRELPSGIDPERDQGSMTVLSAPDGKRYVVHVGGDLPTTVACTGFPQLAEATAEVWAFDIDEETWSLLPVDGPAPRIEYHAGATVKNRFYFAGGWAEEPDPERTCRQVWNERIFELSLGSH